MTTKKTETYANVFIGCDMQGDDCIYIKLGGEEPRPWSRYLTQDELGSIVSHLEEWLNAKDCPIRIGDLDVDNGCGEED